MVEVVGQYTDLKKAGANFSGRCPFHEERTPSFSVNPVEKLYYCFGCGAGGNLIGFVMAKENMDFPEAVEYLADKYGIALEYDESSARGDADRRRRERLRALLEQATAYYERVLWRRQGGRARTRVPLRARPLEEVCRAFRVGYSLPGWEKLRDAALAKGFTEQDLLDAGLVIPGKRGRPYDRFRGRIIFPLGDERGRSLGFGARTLGDEKPKYLNSPETPLYHKSEALFGLDKAKAAAVARTGSTWSRATPTSSPSPRPGSPTWSPPWARLSPSSSCSAWPPHAQRVPLLRRRRRRPRRHGARAHARPAPEPFAARGPHARRSGPRRPHARRPDGDEFRELAEGAQTLLQFQVRSVSRRTTWPSPTAGTRVHSPQGSPCRGCDGPLRAGRRGAPTSQTADLSEESVRYLLSTAGARPAAAGAGGSEQPRASRGAVGSAVATGGAHELEVRFLAGCLAQPGPGREALAGVDEGFFATAETRAALRRVKARLAADGGGEYHPAIGRIDAVAGRRRGGVR